QITGPIFAFTLAAATTVSLAGQTTTHPLPSSGTCTSPGTTLINPTRTSSFRDPRITVTHGAVQSWSALRLPSSATRKSRVTCLATGPSISPAWTKAAVASLTTTPTSSLNQPTAVLLGATPIPAHPSRDRV